MSGGRHPVLGLMVPSGRRSSARVGGDNDFADQPGTQVPANLMFLATLATCKGGAAIGALKVTCSVSGKCWPKVSPLLLTVETELSQETPIYMK